MVSENPALIPVHAEQGSPWNVIVGPPSGELQIAQTLDDLQGLINGIDTQMLPRCVGSEAKDGYVEDDNTAMRDLHLYGPIRLCIDAEVGLDHTLVDHDLNPFAAELQLVRCLGQKDIPPQSDVARLKGFDCNHGGRKTDLHIVGPDPPDMTIVDLPGKRRMLPVLFIAGMDGIQMRVEQKDGFAVSSAPPSPIAHSQGIGLDLVHLHAELPHVVRTVIGDLFFVSRRIVAGNSHQIPEQADGLIDRLIHHSPHHFFDFRPWHI